ncbi:hypothetical protein AB0C77_28225 [Streptomyces sp. NPDC048629]|uniref:hypothetical protein n=1 Tax=Streptomyces sp. NPDC048629 TaxID=3154824 RepID=UPI00343B7259
MRGHVSAAVMIAAALVGLGAGPAVAGEEHDPGAGARAATVEWPDFLQKSTGADPDDMGWIPDCPPAENVSALGEDSCPGHGG